MNFGLKSGIQIERAKKRQIFLVEGCNGLWPKRNKLAIPGTHPSRQLVVDKPRGDVQGAFHQ
jgi:hypothetical protein